MRAEVHVEKKEEALRVAREWSDSDQENTIWTDGSRLENGAVGAAVAFREGGSWKRRGTYLGRNKEVFDAKVFAISQALEILNDREEENVQYTIFSDSQAALSRVQHDRTGPGQIVVIHAITTVRIMVDRGNTVTL